MLPLSHFRFKFDLFRGVISEVVNLTKTAEEGLEAAAERADTGSGCSFRFLLAQGSKLQLGVETTAGSCKKKECPLLFELLAGMNEPDRASAKFAKLKPTLGWLHFVCSILCSSTAHGGDCPGHRGQRAEVGGSGEDRLRRGRRRRPRADCESRGGRNHVQDILLAVTTYSSNEVEEVEGQLKGI